MLIRSKYASRCKVCRRQISVGESVHWVKGIKGVTCTDHDAARKPKDPSPEIPPRQAVTPKGTTPKVVDTFRIEWSELREACKRLFRGDFSDYKRSANRYQASSATTGVRESWTGYSAGQLERWINEGYQTDTIKGLSEFTPPIREKRRLKYDEEGDEFNLDLAYSGDDKYMSEWTKRQTIPGAAVEAEIGFQANTSTKIVNDYGRWLCRAIYSLEATGVDCDVTMKYLAQRLYNPPDRHNNIWREVIVRVKKENEVADFFSFAAMIGPAQYRSFTFVANCLFADSRGQDVSPGMGRADFPGKTWRVEWNAEKRTLEIGAPWHPEGSFPETHMTNQLKDALKEMAKG